MIGPSRIPYGELLALPPQNIRFRLRVSAWLNTVPPEPRGQYMAPFADDERLLARRLARQLNVPWVDPLVGIPAELATHLRWLRSAQHQGHRGVTIWLLQVGAVPAAFRRRRREFFARRHLLGLPIESGIADVSPED